MKNRLILKQHMPYATMLSRALDFCGNMLMHSDVLYPFAVVMEKNDFHCIFLPSPDQQASPEMIEHLQMQLQQRQNTTNDTVHLLVYPAIVTHPDSTETDALVFTINDSQGNNTITVYPYEHSSNGIIISQPYTCDFPD